MQADFWHERWQANQIGFHESAVNPMLVEHWPALDASAGASVFVPLCGKSLDLCWLRAQGCLVSGIELSAIAVESFFAEQDLAPQRSRQEPFERFEAEGITLWQGDFFALDRQVLGTIDAVYDRASLIALPPAMREQYAEHLLGLVDPGTPVLLITVEYDQREMQGPPFSVGEHEVERLFGADCGVHRLTDAVQISVPAGLANRGLERLHERVYRLRKR